MKKICPLIKGDCLEHGCVFWKDIIFQEAGQSETRWDCAIRWLVPLAIENAKETRQAAASADKKATEFQMGFGQLLTLAATRNQLEKKS